MTIQIKKEVTEEIEIGEFPIYRKSICGFFKITSMKECVRVMSILGVQIEVLNYVPDDTFKKEESNEKEFNEAYDRAAWEIDNKAKGVPELSLNHQLSPGLPSMIECDLTSQLVRGFINPERQRLKPY